MYRNNFSYLYVKNYYIQQHGFSVFTEVFFLYKYENEAIINHKFYKTLHAYIPMLLSLKSSHSILKQVK